MCDRRKPPKDWQQGMQAAAVMRTFLQGVGLWREPGATRARLGRYGVLSPGLDVLWNAFGADVCFTAATGGERALRQYATTLELSGPTFSTRRCGSGEVLRKNAQRVYGLAK